MAEGRNPLTRMDYPDPDVIRVGDTYYMISTTMHFFPGGVILRSYDLIHWEICSYVYETLEHTPGEILEGDQTIYGHGMWAASLRYHKGKFYAAFIAHEWDRTFLFTADSIGGPWKKSYIQGVYHDCSLLFDDDDRIYIAYGNRDIRLTELKADLSGPKPGGLDRIIVRDAPGGRLGYEGSHLYKINGKYVLFLIHSKQWKWYRTQACFVTDDLESVWAGGDVMEADLENRGSGPAQGGVVDTPDGRWFSIVFQDRGASGRIPVLVPVTWNAYGYPVFGTVTEAVENGSTRPDAEYEPLYSDDDFRSIKLKKVWQFNHEPREGYWQTGDGSYRITTDKISLTVEHARNTLTQRTIEPGCIAEVTVDAEKIRDGDTAGLCMLISHYSLIGIAREKDTAFLTVRGRRTGEKEETESARIAVTDRKIRLRAEARFTGSRGEVRYFLPDGDGWKQLGDSYEMVFTLEHFVGCRFGLFLYAQKETGGTAGFSDFRYIPM